MKDEPSSEQDSAQVIPIDVYDVLFIRQKLLSNVSEVIHIAALAVLTNLSWSGSNSPSFPDDITLSGDQGPDCESMHGGVMTCLLSRASRFSLNSFFKTKN